MGISENANISLKHAYLKLALKKLGRIFISKKALVI